MRCDNCGKRLTKEDYNEGICRKCKEHGTHKEREASKLQIQAEKRQYGG